jgi:hypothetical protein
MDRIEISPARRWVWFAWLAAAAWLVIAVAITIAAWMSADWGARALTAWVLLLSGGFITLVASRWKTLDLRADDKEIRFGKRVVRRSEVAAIAIEPVGNTPARYWFWVAVMAITQNLSRTVSFRAANGRSLLTTTDLYGSDRLKTLADFLHVPLIGERRRVS